MGLCIHEWVTHEPVVVVYKGENLERVVCVEELMLLPTTTAANEVEGMIRMVKEMENVRM